MLRVHGNQWDEADLEPVAGFSRYHGGVMAPRADSWLLVSIWFDLRRAAEHDGDTKKEIQDRKSVV